MAHSLLPDELSVLQHCPLFHQIPLSAIHQLLNSILYTVEEFSAHTTLYEPTCFRHCLGVVLSGQIDVTNGPVSMSHLTPGHLFGAAALYQDEDTYTTTLTVHIDSRILFLPEKVLDQLLGEYPQIRHNYLAYLSSRIRFLSARLRCLAQTDVEGKLMDYLLENQVNGRIQMSSTELAKTLSISRASLYRAFDVLETSGFLTRKGKTLIIHP